MSAFQHGNFKYYYPNSGHARLWSWHRKRLTGIITVDLVPELWEFKTLYQHMGLVPVGKWFVPIVVNPSTLAWGLENFPENTLEDITKNELSWVPYYPWFEQGEPRPKWRQKDYS